MDILPNRFEEQLKMKEKKKMSSESELIYHIIGINEVKGNTKS